jgi:hypothetical protein
VIDKKETGKHFQERVSREVMERIRKLKVES